MNSRFHFAEGFFIEACVGGPEARSPHFSCGGTDIVVHHFLMFKVDESRKNKLLAVKEGPNCDLNTRDEFLYLEAFDLFAPAFAIAF
ncbi:hypothetical protein D3C87_1855510 [compost metagenome]